MLEAVIETPNGAGRTLFHGDLALDQDEPILIDSVKRVIYKEDPLSSNYDSLSMNEIIEQYHWRKERLSYDYSALVQPFGSPHKTSLDFTINIPKQQRVAYIPGVL